MAVMRNSIIFGGVDSADYGIYIGGEGTFNAPKRDVEMISIPGRNGAFALDKGRFENIEVTYSAFNYETDLATFAQNLSDFRNAICSQKGYQRLTDTFHTDEYRMAAYISGLEIKPIDYNTASKFDIVFDCKPQRFLTSGEDEITIGQWGETQTVSGSIATFEGNGATGIKSLVAEINPIQNLNGYTKPWVGGAGKNKMPTMTVEKTDLGITVTPQADGSLIINGTATGTFTYTKQVTLVSGESYIMSGCPSGGSSSTYRLDIYGTGLPTVPDYGSGSAIFVAPNNFVTLRVVIYSGVTFDNSHWYPMIRLSSVSDATYEPYENICPISGHTEVNVSRTGKNLCPRFPASGTVDGVNYTTNADGSVTASGTSAGTHGFFAVTTEKVLPIGDYILSAGANASINLRLTVAIYKTGSTQYIDCTSSSSVSFSITNDVTGVSIYIRTNGGNTAISETLYPMIRLASETDITYEQYNGDKANQSLGQTVYGGTLDVTSGVLTITHAITTVNDLTWTYNSSSTVFWASVSGMLRPCTLTCSHYAQDFSTTVQAIPNNCIWNEKYAYTSTNIVIKDTRYTDAATFKTNMSGAQIVYELATPTTVQLTAQQLSAISGINNVWADSGDVTVQYGNAPNMIYNPTLFDARPLLEVEGYGNINIGDDTITLNDVAMGEIVIHDPVNKSSSASGTLYEYSFYFDDTDINSGDTIMIPWVQGTYGLSTKQDYIATTCTITSATSATGTSSANGRGKRVRMEEVSFTYGTASTKSGNVVFSQGYKYNGTSHTISETVTLSVIYATPNQLTFRLNTNSLPPCFRITSKQFNSSKIYADSTKSALGHPTYIDLDIGEAYLISNGVPVSLNNVASLPNELPVLKPDGTEITYDNTVTDLKVVPRWWKV